MLYKTFARTFVIVLIFFAQKFTIYRYRYPILVAEKGVLFSKLSLSQKSDALPKPKMILVNAKQFFRESLKGYSMHKLKNH